jgi:hypothetical protein
MESLSLNLEELEIQEQEHSPKISQPKKEEVKIL